MAGDMAGYMAGNMAKEAGLPARDALCDAIFALHRLPPELAGPLVTAVAVERRTRYLPSRTAPHTPPPHRPPHRPPAPLPCFIWPRTGALTCTIYM